MNKKQGQRSRKDSANLCVVCCEEFEFYAIGSCDHSVCYRCCVRMRVLGNEKYCPVCRTDLDKVFLTTNCYPYAEVSSRAVACLFDKKHGIVYETRQIKKKVKELLEHKCSLCSEEQQTFPNFSLLRRHMQRVHQLYYCDLCVDHLRKFSHERKAYNRSDLARHRRIGDVDDTSHKGHPLCEFCDWRYLDNDELHRHLRKEHYYCHICEKIGSQEYYDNYEGLADHFRSVHFLCEEGECLREKFVVFSSKIDMQAHIALKHGQKLSKAQARQNRQLKVDIQFVPRSKPQRHAVSGRDYVEVQSADQSRRYSRNRNREQNMATDREMVEDFQQAVINSMDECPSNGCAHSPKSQQRNKLSNKSSKVKEVDDSKSKAAEEKLEGACALSATRQTLKQPALKEFPSLHSYVQTGNQQSVDKLNVPKAVTKQRQVKSALPSNSWHHGLDEDFPTLNPNNKSSQPGFQLTHPPGFSKAVSSTETSTLTENKQQKFPTELNKAPPGLSRALSGPNNALSGIDYALPGQNVAPRGLETAPPGLGNGPLIQSSAPPPGLGVESLDQSKSAPLDIGNRTLTQNIVPSGVGNKHSTKKVSEELKPTSIIKERVTNGSEKDSLPKSKQQAEQKQLNSVQERNQNLVETIQKLLAYDKGKFSEFKALSGSFRKGVCSGDEYFTKCCNLFGSNIGSVFNELVDLLPDKEKQQELLRARQDAKIRAKQDGKTVVKQKKKETGLSAWGAKSGPPVSQDYPVTQPSLVIQGPLTISSQDFPSLPAASKTRSAPRIYQPNKQKVQMKSAWVRGK